MWLFIFSFLKQLPVLDECSGWGGRLWLVCVANSHTASSGQLRWPISLFRKRQKVGRRRAVKGSGVASAEESIVFAG